VIFLDELRINNHMSKTIRTTDGEINLGTTKITEGATSSIHIPTGSTAQRPTAPTSGTLRYNTDLAKFEGYNGVSWVSLAVEAIGIAPVKLPSYTITQLNALTGITVGSLAYCSNATGGAIPVFYDGINWRRASDRTVIN
jgi:hypothetical protein